MSSIADTSKKRGRPSTGIGSNVGLRLYPELETALDAYVAAQPEPKPSRPEAIRTGLREWLTGLGHLSADGTKPEPAALSNSEVADRYADADPDEAVMVTGVGPMILRRAVRKQDDWREHHGLGLVLVYRGADKEPSVLDMADLGRLAEMERFR